ncbi:MAG: hypothetical protein M1268_03375 [Patescibacteria group bacterium]|nr:hypothetical protein [Patescibacteria group bacterium]
MSVLKTRFLIPILILIFGLIVLFVFFNPFKQPQDNSLKEWVAYKSQNFEVKYPQSWKTETDKYSGGDSLIIKPAYLSNGNNYPSLLIESFSDSSRFKESQDIFQNLNFTKTDTVVDNNPAIKFTGTFPVKNIDGKYFNSPVRETLFFVKHFDSMYLIHYQYEGDSFNEQSESIFSSILSSLKFN